MQFVHGTDTLPGELTVLSYNVEGIVSKLKDKSFVSLVSDYDIVCLVETFVKDFSSRDVHFDLK